MYGIIRLQMIYGMVVNGYECSFYSNVVGYENSSCVFPFTVNGVEYNDCIYASSGVIPHAYATYGDGSNGRWCSQYSIYNTTSSRLWMYWSLCNCTTPAPTTSSPTVAPTTAVPTTPSPTTAIPTALPTVTPTEAPTLTPTEAPTLTPTTQVPTDTPTTAPAEAPTDTPTNTPTTNTPTNTPTAEATTSSPTQSPIPIPPITPTPTRTPTSEPTRAPTLAPTRHPTMVPTMTPTNEPTKSPTQEEDDGGIALWKVMVILLTVFIVILSMLYYWYQSRAQSQVMNLNMGKGGLNDGMMKKKYSSMNEPLQPQDTKKLPHVLREGSVYLNESGSWTKAYLVCTRSGALLCYSDVAKSKEGYNMYLGELWSLPTKSVTYCQELGKHENKRYVFEVVDKRGSSTLINATSRSDMEAWVTTLGRFALRQHAVTRN